MKRFFIALLIFQITQLNAVAKGNRPDRFYRVDKTSQYRTIRLVDALVLIKPRKHQSKHNDTFTTPMDLSTHINLTDEHRLFLTCYDEACDNAILEWRLEK